MTPQRDGGQKSGPRPRSGASSMASRREDEISFKEHFEEILAGIRKLEEERWKGHEDVHKMGQKAFDAAIATLITKMETMNEFRAQIAEERGDFLKRELYYSEQKALGAKMEAREDAIDIRFGKIENYNSNQAGRTAAYVSVAGIAFAVLELLLHFWK